MQYPSQTTRASALCFSLCLLVAVGRTAQACDPNPDPLGLAGPHTVFVNNCSAGTSIVPNNAYTREQAMNPNTPLADLFGLRLNSIHSKLKSVTSTNPVGDTVYIRGGTYDMPMISVWNRLVFWNESGISIKAYPGENVYIRGSSFLPGGVPPNTLCYPVAAESFCTLNLMLQFWYSNDVTVEGITFIGNTPATILINGQNVSGNLYQPYMLQFYGCHRLTLRNLDIRDFISAQDIGLGNRYQQDSVYHNTEYIYRGLTVSYSTGLEMDNVRVTCSSDDPFATGQPVIPWNAVAFITESISGTPTNPARIHNCHFGACPGNAVELSTVGSPQSNVIFDHNSIDNWRQGVQIGGSGRSQDLEISNNRITFNRRGPTESADGGCGVRLGNSDRVKIVNNVIYQGDHFGAGIQLSAGQVDAVQSLSVNDTLIAHNTLFRAGSQAIALVNDPNPDGSIPINRITRTRVVNNLIYQINEASALSSNTNNSKRELYLQFPHFEDSLGYSNTFSNNLFVPARSDGKTIGSGDFGDWRLNGSVVGSWQCYVNPQLGGCGWLTCAPNAGCEIPTRYKYDGLSFNSLPSVAQNNLKAAPADPMFVNATNNDFHLIQGSTAINRATYLAEVPTDIDGVFRANGGGCTIGAYEYDAPSVLRPGDLNCDNQVTPADVPSMVMALVNTGRYLMFYSCAENGDINHDGRLDGRDIRGFVDLLTP